MAEKRTAKERVIAYLRRVKNLKSAREVADACSLTIYHACVILKALSDDGEAFRDGSRCAYTYELAA